MKQHVAELAAVHLDRGPRIERAAEALRDGLIADAADPRRHLARAAVLAISSCSACIPPRKAPPIKTAPKRRHQCWLTRPVRPAMPC